MLVSGSAIIETLSVGLTGVHCIGWVSVEFADVELLSVMFDILGGSMSTCNVTLAGRGLAVTSGVLVKYMALACLSANCLSTSRSAGACCTSSDWGAARLLPVLSEKVRLRIKFKKEFNLIIRILYKNNFYNKIKNIFVSSNKIDVINVVVVVVAVLYRWIFL